MYGIGVIVGVPFENVDHFAIHNHGPDMPYLG